MCWHHNMNHVIARDNINNDGGQGSDETPVRLRGFLLKDEEPTAEQRDDAAEERDKAAGLRDNTADRRDRIGEKRDKAAGKRDETADQRDVVAGGRDHSAEERDEAAERSETESTDITGEVVVRSALARQAAASDRRGAAQDREAGANERTQAEADRGTAQIDRRSGGAERSYAGSDRGNARADRGASARDRDQSSMDELTGLYGRRAGFIELEREIAKARRTAHRLLVAFVDVDHLKSINDQRGHAAGDRMLIEVANTLGTVLRAYDVIIRYGGDEFLCVITDLNPIDANERFALVNAALAEAPNHGSVTIGLAELQPGDSPQDLIARADAALYRTRDQYRN
jgi:diguanylate cyclase (GGDEF)-like protein